MLTAYLALVVFPFNGVNFDKDWSRNKRTLYIDNPRFATVVFCTKNKFYCSGTLVHLEYVLTSAHCFYDLHGVLTEDDTSITVMAGSERVKFDEQDFASGKVQFRESKRLIIHHGYAWSENFVNDLAIIHLKKPFNKTDFVDVAPLQKSNPQKLLESTEGRDYPWNIRDFHSLVDLEHEDWMSHTCIAFGYGESPPSRNSEMDRLSTMKLQVIDVAKHCYCLEKVRSVRSPFHIIKVRNIFLCDQLGFSGICCGDNGGMLLCNNMLRGIATTVFHYESRVHGSAESSDDESSSTHKNCHPLENQPNDCGNDMSMSVYTDLCHFSEWLHQHIPGYPLTNKDCKHVDKPAVKPARMESDL